MTPILIVIASLAATPDLTGDAIVDSADIGLLLGYWGTPAGDLTGDGVTDSNDLGAMLGAFNTSTETRYIIDAYQGIVYAIPADATFTESNGVRCWEWSHTWIDRGPMHSPRRQWRGQRLAHERIAP